MAVIKIPLKDYAGYLQKLGPRLNQAVKRGVVSGAYRSVALLQQRSRSVDAVNTGAYLRAWKSSATSFGAVVFNDRPYAGVIEQGRRPGATMPPTRAIAQWAQRKLGLGAEEARAVSFAIARSIKEKGIDGRQVLEGATEDIRELAGEEIDREIKVELAKP